MINMMRVMSTMTTIDEYDEYDEKTPLTYMVQRSIIGQVPAKTSNFNFLLDS